MAARTPQMSQLVSVIMSVYNGQDYVAQAIESILNQSYKKIEFIIIDDGSTDKTLKIIRSFNDPRIKVISRKNKGLVASLNEGIRISTGEYIARQDADDISLPKRLEDQINAFAKNPKLVLCGTAFQDVDEKGKKGQITQISFTSSLLKLELYARSPFCHGSIMAKRASVIKVGGYRGTVGPAEDYDLWIRLRHEGEYENIRPIRFLYRIQPDSISHLQSDAAQDHSMTVRDRLWKEDPPASIIFIRAFFMNFRQQPKYLPLFFSRYTEFTSRFHKTVLRLVIRLLVISSKLNAGISK